jgi:DNA repair protein RecN (Recombination protein N)
MLLSLRIENFALIDRLEIGFGPGLNVLTGETGAGKSIILDAIEVLLGGRMSPGRLIRTGAERTCLEASFLLSPDLKNWLAAQEIDPLEDDQLICSREISQTPSGLRSRSRLNGILVNRQQLDGLRDRLVSITAQGQAVKLGQVSQQRQWLDEFGGVDLLHQKTQVAQDWQRFQQADQALELYHQTQRQRLQKVDGLEYQLRELQQAQLQNPHEQTLVDQEYQRLSHSGELQQQSYRVYEALYEQEQGLPCGDLLGQALGILTEMSVYDPAQIQPILELVQTALTQTQEAGRQIYAYAANLETDPQRSQELAERLMQLKQICRKYGPTLGEAIAYQQQIEQELAALLTTASAEALQENHRHTQAKLQQSCQQLSQFRIAAAQDLEIRLLQALTPLGMEKVKFRVGIDPISPSAQGAEQIRFLFSPNPGEPLQPLSEIASGGEMSRFLLALQACFSQVDAVGSLIFDEIDVGVSGRISQAIAETLSQLGRHHQVLCVTHQPVIAAMGDRHFRVQKQVNAAGLGRDETERTVIRVLELDQQQRRQELAQLSGGQSLEQAIAFAESLLNQAATFRNSNPPQPKSKQQRKLKSRA